MRTRTPAHPKSAPALGGPPPGRSGGGAPSRVSAMRRRRQLPYLLLGLLLVLGCAAGGVVAGTQLGDREAVLVLAHPVGVGQELSAKDVREVSVSADSGLTPIRADALSSVEGRPFAYSLPAGAVLTREALGKAQVPPDGQAVAAVGLEDGQFPAAVKPGNQVLVVIAPENETGTGADGETSSPSSHSATVTDVRAKDSKQTTVISLQLPADQAQQVAAAPQGQVSVVVVPGGGQ